MNRKIFYDTIRPHVNLTTQNVQGMEKLLDYAIKRPSMLNLQWLAYVIATAWWETGQTMQPVKEAYWKSEEWRRKNLRYYPWYGRGLIQTTWEDNYRRIAIAMGLPADTFTKNKDLLLMHEYALPAMFVGMEKGIYTGKALGDYIDNVDESDEEDYKEYVNARRIVNGTDKSGQIAKLALVFEKGLKAAGYVGAKAPPVTSPPKEMPKPVVTEKPAETPKDHVPVEVEKGGTDYFTIAGVVIIIVVAALFVYLS